MTINIIAILAQFSITWGTQGYLKLSIMKQLVIALAAAVALYSCTSNAGPNTADTAMAIEQAKKATIDSMNTVTAIKQQVIDSMNEAKEARADRARSVEYSAPASNSYSNNAEAYPAPAAEPAPAPAPVEQKKKGWSHTAKGAVVGAGAGAITGAIVNPDRAKGAIIGTLIGAGVGAGTGALVDKKKKREAAAQQ